MIAGCTRRNSAMGRTGRDERDRDAAGEHVREYAETRHHRRVEVDASDPDGDSDADRESEHRADHAEGGGFGGEESVDQAFGCAQGLHDGEVAAAVEDPSDERGEHAERGGQDDERGRGVERGARLVQDVGFAFHDLADGADVGGGQGLARAVACLARLLRSGR